MGLERVAPPPSSPEEAHALGREKESIKFQAEYAFDGVEAGLAAREPLGGANGSARKMISGRGAVDEFESFALADE